MLQFGNVAARRLLDGAETCLCSLGLALLVFSVLLVPTSAVVADDGAGGLAAPGTGSCKPADGCNLGGCDVLAGQCPTASNTCQDGTTPCSTCPCKGCYGPMQNYICGCRCYPMFLSCTGPGGTCN